MLQHSRLYVFQLRRSYIGPSAFGEVKVHETTLWNGTQSMSYNVNNDNAKHQYIKYYYYYYIYIFFFYYIYTYIYFQYLHNFNHANWKFPWLKLNAKF